MTDARHKGFWHRTGLIGGAGAMLLLAASAEGCGGDDTTTSTTASTGTGMSTATCTGGSGGEGGGNGGSGGTGGTGGSGGSSAMISLNEACVGNDATFSTPFDATPDPEGVNVYFTALNVNGDATVFKGPAAGGGACTPLYAGGDPLVAPFNIVITTDSKTLFIADSGSDDALESDGGHVFTLSSMGGAPAVFTGTEGRRPRGIDIYKDADAEVLYFTGTDPATGERGVFSVLAAGGQVAPVAKGAAFQDPSGIAVSTKKVAYVCDTTGTESGIANILSVDEQGNVAVLVAGLHAGYPCGIALTLDDAFAFVSAIDPLTGTDVIARIKLDTKDVDFLSQGIDTFTESAGLHRAKNANSYAWADSKANGSGTVFTVKLQ